VVVVLLSQHTVAAQTDDQSIGCVLETRLVAIDAAIVSGKTGQLKAGINPKDFLIYEDGVQQHIAMIERRHMTLSIVLLIDPSALEKGGLTRAQLGRFESEVTDRLEAKDRVSTIAIDDDTLLMQEFTDDKDSIRKSIESVVKYETHSLELKTRYEFALQEAISQQSSSPVADPKRIVVMISSIPYSLANKGLISEETARQLFNSGIQLYWCNIPPLSLETRAVSDNAESNEFKLSDLVDLTGGEITNRRSLLPIDRLHDRYLIAYTPTNDELSGGIRRIRLTLTPEALEDDPTTTLFYRKGYYVSDSFNDK